MALSKPLLNNQVLESIYQQDDITLYINILIVYVWMFQYSVLIFYVLWRNVVLRSNLLWFKLLCSGNVQCFNILYSNTSLWSNFVRPDFLCFILLWSEAAVQRCSKKNVFLKCAANLHENTHVEVWVQKSCKATLLKSHFGLGVLL